MESPEGSKNSTLEEPIEGRKVRGNRRLEKVCGVGGKEETRSTDRVLVRDVRRSPRRMK